jgi:uncharacterized membrane protein YdjX (TVP38/TMEM64 family)
MREKDAGPRLSLSTPVVRFLIGLAIALLIAAIFYFYHEGLWRCVLRYYRYFFDLKKLKLFIASFGPYSVIAFIVLQALQVVFAPIPGEVTGFVGGLLFGMLWGTVLSTIGLTIGAILAFWIARFFGYDFVRKVVRNEYIDKFDYFVTHRGLYIAFILFVIPGFPKDSLCYLLGLTHMRYREIILMNLIGRLPGTFILCMQGNAVRNGQFKYFWILFAASICLTAVLYFTRNYIIHFYAWCKSLVDGKKENKDGKTYPVEGKDVE